MWLDVVVLNTRIGFFGILVSKNIVNSINNSRIHGVLSKKIRERIG